MIGVRRFTNKREIDALRCFRLPRLVFATTTDKVAEGCYTSALHLVLLFNNTWVCCCSRRCLLNGTDDRSPVNGRARNEKLTHVFQSGVVWGSGPSALPKYHLSFPQSCTFRCPTLFSPPSALARQAVLNPCNSQAPATHSASSHGSR